MADDVFGGLNFLTDSLLQGNNLLFIIVALIVLAFLFYYFRGRKPETTDLREMVRADRGPMEKIVSLIPVYHGYKEREMRRDADKALRDYLARRLQLLQRDLKGVFRNALEADMTELTDRANSATALFDKIIAKISRADYGYTGFWDALKIREEELDRMYEFDEKLLSWQEALNEKIRGFSKAVDSENIKNAKAALAELSAELKDFDDVFSERKDFMLKIAR